MLDPDAWLDREIVEAVLDFDEAGVELAPSISEVDRQLVIETMVLWRVIPEIV